MATEPFLAEMRPLHFSPSVSTKNGFQDASGPVSPPVARGPKHTSPCTLPTSAALEVWPERWTQCRARLPPPTAAGRPPDTVSVTCPVWGGAGSTVKLHSLSHFLLKFGWGSSETHLYPVSEGFHRDRGGQGWIWRPPPPNTSPQDSSQQPWKGSPTECRVRVGSLSGRAEPGWPGASTLSGAHPGRRLPSLSHTVPGCLWPRCETLQTMQKCADRMCKSSPPLAYHCSPCQPDSFQTS